MEILLATNNLGKVKDFKKLFEKLPQFKLLTLNEIGCTYEVEETEATFIGNALKKAEEIAKITGIPTIADDSGIEVEALDGYPGVKTKRAVLEKMSISSTKITDSIRNQYIIDMLDKTNSDNRKATCTCAICYYVPVNTTIISDQSIIVQEKIEGEIVKVPTGNNGFGFDPIFRLKSGKTLAELTAEEKNKVSARAIAMRSFIKDFVHKYKD